MRLSTWLDENHRLPRLDLELLLCARLKLTRAQVIAHRELQIDQAALAGLRRDVERLNNAEPLAYILGSREFYGITLSVNPAVLIPRPETELLVDLALKVITPGMRVLDLATGSGAVAIAIAANCESIELHASDLSLDALNVARHNAHQAGVELTFLESDLFASLNGRYDLVLSNPPYVAENDPHLPALRYEPLLALVSGSDGMTALTRIIQTAPDYLVHNGVLMLEHGFDQAMRVQTLMRESFHDIQTHPDLGAHDRVTTGRRK
ncbi:MAG: peptide chain release factor N(5)-glutamine methyltransferase [Proteobacteria bacterium]|nr:peptide chain release factor N(5)-glutamine methyltransferase [Pseudomonadota bacterium]